MWCLCACVLINEALHKGPQCMKQLHALIKNPTTEARLAVEDDHCRLIYSKYGFGIWCLGGCSCKRTLSNTKNTMNVLGNAPRASLEGVSFRKDNECIEFALNRPLHCSFHVILPRVAEAWLALYVGGSLKFANQPAAISLSLIL